MERLRQFLGQLSERERMWLALAVTGFGAVLAVLLSFSTWKSLRALELRVTQNQTKLAELLSYRGAIESARAAREADEQRLRGLPELALFPYIEDAAKKLGVVVDDMKERSEKSLDGKVEERTVDATVRSLPVDRLADLVAALSAPDKLVHVTRIRLRRRFEDEKKLEATIGVTKFRTLSGT